MLGESVRRRTLVLTALIPAVLFSGCMEMFWDVDGTHGDSGVPALAFTTDENGDRLTVNMAASGADWGRLEIDVPRCTVSPPASVTVYAGSASAQTIRVNADASSSGAALNSPDRGSDCGPAWGKPVGTAPARINAGDYLSFCTMPRENLSVRDVEVRIRDTVANAIMLIATFETVAACSI